MPRSRVQEASTKAHHTVTHCYPAGHRGGVLGVLKHKVLDDKEKEKEIRCAQERSGQPPYNQNEHAKTPEEREEKLHRVQLRNGGGGDDDDQFACSKTIGRKKIVKNNSQKTQKALGNVL